VTDLPQQPADDPLDFGLVSDAGNAGLALLVREVAAAVETGAVERAEAVEALSDGVREIAAENPEAVDVTVRHAVVRELVPAFTAAGWPAPEVFEF